MPEASSASVTIRVARVGDAADIGRVQAESWRSTYAALLPDRVLIRMTPQRQAKLWSHYLRDPTRTMGAIYVAEAADGRVIGFGSCGREQTGALPFRGEVYTLYVDDAWHNQGIGRRLLRAMFARLSAEGLESVVIWVLDGNPARFFYEAMGGVPVAERRGRQWGVTVAERAYGWPEIALAE